MSTKRLSLAGYLILVGVAAAYLKKNPEYNWDLIPYVGAVLAAEGQSPEMVHRETYRLVRAALPESRFAEFIATPYRQGIFENPDYLIQQLPFYAIRPGYLGALRLLHGLGINLVTATVMISIACYLGMCAILWRWLGRWLSDPARLACAACLALTQPLLEVAGLTTPDALSSLLVLLAFYLFAERDRVVAAALLLALSLVVRTDNVIVCVLFAGLVLWRWRSSPGWKRALVGAYAGAALLGVAACHHAAASYGWRITIYHSFIANLLAPAQAPRLSLVAFVKILVGGAGSVRYSSIAFCLLLFTCALLARQSAATSARDGLRLSVATLMLASILGHMLVFPAFRDRFFVAQYLIISVMSVRWLVGAQAPQRAPEWTRRRAQPRAIE